MKTKTQFMNRILSLALVLVMVLGMLPMTVSAADRFNAETWGEYSESASEYVYTYADFSPFDSNHGHGSAESPYLISTPEQLAGFAALVNAYDGSSVTLTDANGNTANATNFFVNAEKQYVKLTADIDLSEHDWIPIGTDDIHAFKGSFDGAGHTISGLSINSATINYAGLFGYVTEGMVKNVGVSGVVNVEYSATVYVGGLVGYAAAATTIENCYSTCNVSGRGMTSNAGGLVGDASYVTITNSYNTGSVSGTGTTSSNAGGLVGNASYATITNSYNTGSVSGTGLNSNVGGCIGRVGGIVTITDCYWCEECSSKSIGSGDTNGSSIRLSQDQMKAAAGETDLSWDMILILDKAGSLVDALNKYVVDDANSTTVALTLWHIHDGEYPTLGAKNETITVDTDGQTHTVSCTGCSFSKKETHTGGEATCTTRAVCENCGASYGEVDTTNHDYDDHIICTKCGNPAAQITGTAVNDDFSVTFFVEHDDYYLPWEALQFVVYNGDQIVPLNINYDDVERPYATMTGLKPDCKGITLTAEIVIDNVHMEHEKTMATVEVKNPDDHSGALGDPVPTEDGKQHVEKWSCCGATVTEDHALTYTANGSTIIAACSANCGYTGTATISAAGKTYDGTAVEATVTKIGSLENAAIAITYAVKDGATLDGAPVNAGTYTAFVTLGDQTVSVDFTIAKADVLITAPTPNTLTYTGIAQNLISEGAVVGGTMLYSLSENGEYSTTIPQGINAGDYTVWYYVQGDVNHNDSAKAPLTINIKKATLTVTADARSKNYGEADPELTYTVSGLFGEDKLTGALTRAEGENAGKYAISQGTLTAGDNYTISFTGAELTITDKTAPTGEILIKENGWNKFWNSITFGIFCKDYVDVTITADGTGSGVTKVEYLRSGTVLDENNIPTEGWTEISNNNGKYGFSIQPQNKVAVYVRITDEGGNVTVINSDGIVVYEDSKAVDTEVTYTYKENSNRDISVEFNGNTVKSIVCGEKTLAVNNDYSVDYESGKIVLAASYLDTLNAGDYNFTVTYNPMGVENSGVTDLTTTFIVKVVPTSIAGATVTVNDTFTYNNNAKTPDPVVLLNGKALIKDTDYTISYVANTNAGTATITVTGKGNYSGTASGNFEIGRTELTDVSVQQNGTLTYDGGKALTPAVTANATALNGAKVLFIYSADGSVYGSMPSFTEAGTYTVHYCAYTTDDNFFDHHGTFTVTIDKATVTEPTIASKPFTNSAQKADISDTDLYAVVQNNGGTEKGSYDVVLKLKNSANYKWSTTDSAEVTLQFVISAAQNAWDTAPAISGWTYGEAAKTPVGTAKYGDVKVVYSGKANDGTDYNSETAPTKAGNYTATFTVTGTEDYSGLSEQVNFTIAKKAVTVIANDASKTYGDSDPALTYTHTELVGQDALDISVSRASGENANTYTIIASQAEGANPNYEITFKTGAFTILKATLTITAADKSATYGDAVPTYAVKYEGFKNGDDKDDLSGALVFDCGYAQFSNKGEYTIKASGYTSGNYTISYVDGKLTVNAKPITVTIQNATSVYGDTLAELKATDNGIVNGDANVYSLATIANSTSNVGKYAITGTALDGNYDVTFVNGEYEITKREITITVDAKNTVVNTTLPTYTYKVEGLVGADKLKTEPTLTCNADITVIGEYDITATGAEAGDNYSIKYVPAKLTVLNDNAVDAATGYTEKLKDYDPATVTSEDKAELIEMLSEINSILADETTTDNGKKALVEVKEKVEDLIKEITDAADVTDTENVGKVESVTPENVTPENKNNLEGAKADLEKALEDHGSNMTEAEKKDVEAEIKRIDEALEVIGNVEAVEESISKLPAVDTVKPDDEEAIKAITDAQIAYNALSDYEKSLVDEATKETLDKLVATLVAYAIVEGDGSSWTEDSDHNITFVANGLFSKFVGIKIDGKDVDKANYEVKAGSTIITLKASYLDILKVGEHTITVVYTDGSTDGTFNVHAKANSLATGDNSHMMLWIALLFISGGAVITLTVVDRKKRAATKR